MASNSVFAIPLPVSWTINLIKLSLIIPDDFYLLFAVTQIMSFSLVNLRELFTKLTKSYNILSGSLKIIWFSRESKIENINLIPFVEQISI